MASQWKLIILIPVLWLTLNIKALDCRSPDLKGVKDAASRGIKPGEFNRAINHASEMITEFPYGFSQAVDAASGVFSNVLGKIFSKKKFLGIESFYYK